MKKWIWMSGLVLLLAAPAFADVIYYAPSVTGKRDRNNVRHFLYVKNLTGDKKVVYDEYGYTPYRLRFNEYGVIREKWTYYEAGKVFEFDQCGRLTDEHNVPVEQRRAWAYQHDDRNYVEDVSCDK